MTERSSSHDKVHKRGGGAAPTLSDVAKHAGVSRMTVSRVVNGQPLVVESTRDKVNAAIEALGYVPNSAARSLAAGGKSRIALVHCNPSAAYLSEFLMGALAQTGASGAQLVVEHYDENDKAADIVKRLSRHRVNAVLLPPPLCDDASLLECLAAAHVEIVQIATGRPVPFAHAVTIDNVDAAKAMTKHLIAMGHSRIGFIVGSANQAASGLRLRGYEEALRESGIALDPGLVALGDFTYRSGLEAAQLLLAEKSRPTAIFASNDDMAAATVAVAQRLGIDVPTGLSVCGFDDTAMATAIWPELTTIRQPISEMSQLAAEMLSEATQIGHIGHARSTRHVRLQYQLVCRESVARRRSRD